MLEYHLPGLGRITAKLYPFSEKCYGFLNSHNQINRMREMDQLGVIRNVYEGAHHSRWEYVMTQLSLVYKLSTPDETSGIKPMKGWGLSYGVNFDGIKISGADIIQTWVLLLNSGHLHGTFSSEKALLKCLKKDKTLKRTMKRGLSDSQVRSYLDEIIESEDIYGIHKIFSFFFLERFKHYDPEFVDLLFKVLKFYCFEQTKYAEKRENLRYVFKRLRHVSYLFLDAQYGPTPLDFDFPAIFMNLPDYLDELLDSNSALVKTLYSLDNFLAKEVYHSPYSMRAHIDHVSNLMNIIENDEEIRNKISGLKWFLKDSEHLIPNYVDWENSPTFRFLLDNLHPFFSESSRELLNFDLEDKINKNYGTRSCLVAIQPNTRRDLYSISLSFLPKCQSHKRFEILGKFIKDLIKIRGELISEHPVEFLADRAFDESFRNLMIFVLNEITKKELIFYFQRDNYPYFSTLSASGSKNAADKLEEVIEEGSGHSIPSPRLHELKMGMKSLRDINHPSPIIVSLNQIKIQDKNRIHVSDLDCAGLGYNKGQLYLLLCEAKKGGKATGQLQNTIDKIDLNTSINPELKFLSTFGAYCYIPINGL